MSATKRSLRQRATTGASVVDEALQQELVSARLEALDDDFGVGKQHEEESEDEDFLVDADGEEIEAGKKKKGGKRPSSSKASEGKRKKTRSAVSNKQGFSALLDGAPPEEREAYLRASVGGTALPRRRFCEISGFDAPYTDPITKMRFHSKKEYQMIKETPALAVHARALRKF